jgi:hypothetical protein
MKLALITLALTASAFAAEPAHDHSKKQAGPTGGRLITEVEPHAEFFVNKDKKIEIRFVDDDNKVIAPAGQTVSVVMGDRTAPTKMTCALEGDKLISDITIPEGNEQPTVVQIKVTPDAKAVTEKFNLNLSDCPECDFKEYACICDHAEEK